MQNAECRMQNEEWGMALSVKNQRFLTAPPQGELRSVQHAKSQFVHKEKLPAHGFVCRQRFYGYLPRVKRKEISFSDRR